MPEAAVPSVAVSASIDAARVAVVGGGPAGLMAAETLAAGGVRVEVFDAMPSPGRKFLLAGIGGLNLTHAEDHERFRSRYGPRADWLRPWLDAFPPEALRAWAGELGIETFVGTSQRVFPVGMKAAPLLRAWLKRLRAAGVQLHVRHRWLGWSEDGALRFATTEGETARCFDAVVLALGGGSWARLGSDGAWVRLLSARGVGVSPLLPANCGFDANLDAGFHAKYRGTPIKTVMLSFTDAGGVEHARRGELMVSDTGLEGSLVYALSAPLRDTLLRTGACAITLDLLPDHSAERVAAEVAHPRGSRSLASHLQSRLGLRDAKLGLLYAVLGREGVRDPARLSAAIKALPVVLTAPRPLDEAISSAGGVPPGALDANLMLTALPGVFCAGEMLDWEAPTGGYLLTACFASGRAAGEGVLDWLATR